MKVKKKKYRRERDKKREVKYEVQAQSHKKARDVRSEKGMRERRKDVDQ